MKKLVLTLAVAAVVFLPLGATSGLAGEHGGQEHGGKEHAGHEHGGAEHGGQAEVEAEAEVAVEETVPTQTGPEIHPVTREDGVIELNNPKCLVSGEDVSGKHFYEHNGVNYGFCCKMCIRDFKKDPEQFALSMDVIHNAMGPGGHAH